MRKIFKTFEKKTNKIGLQINKEKTKYMDMRVGVMDEDKMVMVGFRIERAKQSRELETLIIDNDK